MTELAACNTCRQTVVADRDLLIHVSVREIVGALSHGTNEDANALIWTKGIDIVAHSHKRSIEAEGNLSAVWG